MAAAVPILDASPFSATGGEGMAQVNRLVRLLNAADANISARFLELVRGARGVRTLENLAGLIETGRMDEALAFMDQFGEGLNEAITQAYMDAGRSTAGVLARQSNSLFTFNSLNARGVAALGVERARFIRELTNQQRQATLAALQDGVRRGLRPDQIAREVRDSIGLTGRQQRAVSNYRRLLEEGSSEALTRQLRDKRFDPTVRRSIATDTPLTQRQVDRMVDRYQQRSVRARSNVIGRTEGLRATNMGDSEAWEQAVDTGLVDPTTVESTWVTAQDERVRDSHGPMNGQQRPLGEPFISGDGNRLRFPGDPSAPAEDTINCRCVVARTAEFLR